MSRLTDACAQRPFSNGTEGDAWMGAWCRHCTHDHAMHNGEYGPGCELIVNAYLDGPWPEAWLPEPDDGRFFLPSRLICNRFAPCDPCGGDPGTADRAERIAEVTAYWAGSSPLSDAPKEQTNDATT